MSKTNDNMLKWFKNREKNPSWKIYKQNVKSFWKIHKQKRWFSSRSVYNYTIWYTIKYWSNFDCRKYLKRNWF